MVLLNARKVEEVVEWLYSHQSPDLHTVKNHHQAQAKQVYFLYSVIFCFILCIPSLFSYILFGSSDHLIHIAIRCLIFLLWRHILKNCLTSTLFLPSFIHSMDRGAWLYMRWPYSLSGKCVASRRLCASVNQLHVWVYDDISYGAWFWNFTISNY